MTTTQVPAVQAVAKPKPFDPLLIRVHDNNAPVSMDNIMKNL